MFAVLVITATPLLAQEQAAPDPSPGLPAIDESTIIIGDSPLLPLTEDVAGPWVLFRMVLVLSLAALAIYGVVFFIKRLARPQESKDPHLKILARIPITNDTFAAVLSLGAKAYLVGGGAGNLQLISELDDPETLETLLLEDARRTAEGETRRFLDFRAFLPKKYFSQDQNQTQGDNASLSAETLRRQRERLGGLS